MSMDLEKMIPRQDIVHITDVENRKIRSSIPTGITGLMLIFEVPILPSIRLQGITTL